MGLYFGPVTAYPAVGQTNLAAPPPPVGYPTKDDVPAQQHVPVKTTTREGDGFWKGWVLIASNVSLLSFLAVVLDCVVAVPWSAVFD
ncbi:hypothetical protein CR513_08020, partial [Mucuna pruriens]